MSKGPWTKNLKTHCKWGHEYTPENTKRNKKGFKNCRMCLRLAGRKRRRAVAGKKPKIQVIRLQQTHCKWGHEYTPENTGINRRNTKTGGNYRACKECHRLREMARRRAQGSKPQGSGTHCGKGHELTIAKSGSGKKWCKTCTNEKARIRTCITREERRVQAKNRYYIRRMTLIFVKRGMNPMEAHVKATKLMNEAG